MSTIQGRLLKIREAATLLNVSRQALWKWIKQGKIEAVKLPSGQYRIPESEVVKIMHMVLVYGRDAADVTQKELAASKMGGD